MNTIRKSFEGFIVHITKLVVVQVVATVSVSYLLAWISNSTKQGRWWPPVVLPPEFLWILALLSTTILIYHGFINPYIRSRRRHHERMQRRELREREQERHIIDVAYEHVEYVLNPKVLDPEHPGNPAYMRKQARDAVDKVVQQLDAKNIAHPGLIDVESPSELETWHQFLRLMRIRPLDTGMSYGKSITESRKVSYLRPIEVPQREDAKHFMSSSYKKLQIKTSVGLVLRWIRGKFRGLKVGQRQPTLQHSRIGGINHAPGDQNQEHVMRLNTPNLFDYATKELSQDAMICWLIDWAGQPKGVAPEQEHLRYCGLRFVGTLLNHKRNCKDTVELKDVIETEILQQEQGIDVLARINLKHVLLIESKTYTKDHSDQLLRYYKSVEEGRTRFGYVLEREIYPIYLKTGNQSRADDREIEKKHFSVFSIRDFLKVFNEYEGRSAILVDFRQYLRELENKNNSFMEWTKIERQEDKRAWEGFFRSLEGRLDDGTRKSMGWGYVPNPSGGFLGFWWWPTDEEVIYLQIEVVPGEKMMLCFKVIAKGESRDRQEELQGYWHKRIMDAGRGRVVRPIVMRKGNHMTVAWWKDDWLAFSENGKLDMTKTVENLEQAESVLKAST